MAFNLRRIEAVFDLSPHSLHFSMLLFLVLLQAAGFIHIDVMPFCHVNSHSNKDAHIILNEQISLYRSGILVGFLESPCDHLEATFT